MSSPAIQKSHAQKKPSVLKILHIMATNKKNRKIPMTVRGSAAAYAIMQVV